MSIKTRNILYPNERLRIECWRRMAASFSMIPLDGILPSEKEWTKWCIMKRPFHLDDFIGKNAGIACGPASGILVLDIDHLELFANMIKEKGWKLPLTMCVKTGDGGKHFYFNYPNNGRNYGNKGIKIPDPNNPEKKINVFNIRGNGDYVLAKGSIHPKTGKTYDEEMAISIAEPPDWILELFNAKVNEMPKNTWQFQKPSVSDQLFDIGSRCHLFRHKTEGYARIKNDGKTRVLKLSSNEFKNYLRNAFQGHHGKNANHSAIDEAVENLQARAQEESAEEPVYYRITGHEGHIFIDLGSSDRKAVDIHPTNSCGWRIITDPPINFIRKKTTLPLPVPVPGGNINEFRSLINCQDDNTWKMIVGWLICALKPQGPYPVLIIHGEQRAAKSNLSKLCHNLIDPSQNVFSGLPQDCRKLDVLANNAWVLSFDNLSGMRRQFSDAFCKLSTGEALHSRKLYKDDEVIFQVARPIILTGFNNMLKMRDLLDRSILIELEALASSQRKTEAEIARIFNEIRPRLLGALYTAIAKAFQNQNSVFLTENSRMADFIIWVSAAEEALGWNSGEFIKAFRKNQHLKAESALDAFPLAQAILSLMETRDRWEGFAQQLLTDLNQLPVINDGIKNSKNWPGAANAMTNILRKIATILRENKKIDIQMKKTNKGMKIVIRKTSSLTSVPSNGDGIYEVTSEIDD